MLKIFRGEGLVDGEGVPVKDACSWVVGVIKGSLQNIQKQGWAKANVVCRGGGLKVSPP